jgi:anti-sigma-K factor RskA
MMSHEKFDELKDAYALGALPEDELREFEEYLRVHPERQSEVDELTSIAALLAVSPADQEPPKKLRRSVMAMVNAEAANSRRERRRASSPSWRASLDDLRDAFPARIALGAAAMLVVGLLSWNVLLQSEVRDLSGQNSELQAQVEEARSGASEARVLAMQGQGEMSEANAEVIDFEGNDRVILVAENVPSIPDDRTFQIWVIDEGGPKPSGVFEPGGDAVAAVVSQPIEDAQTIAVTVEPAGGSPQPTTDPMLSVRL